MPVRETFTVDAEVQGDRATISAVRQVDEAVEQAEASSSDFGDTVSKEMRLASTSAEEAEQSLRDTAAAQSRVSSASSTMTSGVSSSANALGFELVQASQDAQFGLVGVANQIPLMAEQFQRLQSQTGSTQGAMGALVSALKGPAGVIGAVTLLISFGPKIVDFFQSWIGGAEDASEASEELRNETRSTAQQIFDTLREDEQLQQRAITTLEQAANTARKEYIEALGTSSEEAQKAQDEWVRIGSVIETIRNVSPELEENFMALTELGLSPEVAQPLAEMATNAGEAARNMEDIELPEVEFEDDVGLAPSDLGMEELDPSSVLQTELTEGEKAIANIRSQLEVINAMPFLQGAEAANQRVRAVYQGIRQAQRAGREFSRDEINQIIENMGLAADEAERVRDALESGGEEAEDAQDEVNQKLVQGIQLAGQLGQSLARAFQQGEVEAQQLLGIMLQIAGQAATLAGQPVAGAALQGLGGIISSFEEGGYTGGGPRSAAAGVVHRGEYVMPADVVSALGVDTMQAIHEAASHRPTRADLERLAGVPGYATGGLVTAMTRPVGGGGRDAERIAREAAAQAADETARRVAEEVASRPNIVRIDGRGAQDIIETGQEHRTRKSPRDA